MSPRDKALLRLLWGIRSYAVNIHVTKDLDDPQLHWIDAHIRGMLDIFESYNHEDFEVPERIMCLRAAVRRDASLAFLMATQNITVPPERL